MDDIINVAGHRLGTKEIESASLTVEGVAEAAVVPKIDELKEHVPDLYISLKESYEPSPEIAEKVKMAVRIIIGPIATFAHVYIVPDMPKTRSGKIMRRILACISNGRRDFGDITTLIDPGVVEKKIWEIVHGKELVF